MNIEEKIANFSLFNILNGGQFDKDYLDLLTSISIPKTDEETQQESGPVTQYLKDLFKGDKDPYNDEILLNDDYKDLYHILERGDIPIASAPYEDDILNDEPPNILDDTSNTLLIWIIVIVFIILIFIIIIVIIVIKRKK